MFDIPPILTIIIAKKRCFIKVRAFKTTGLKTQRRPEFGCFETGETEKASMRKNRKRVAGEDCRNSGFSREKNMD